MGFKDEKGIVVASGFKLQANQLLDVRNRVKTITERNELVTLNACPIGLIVYVSDENKLYVYRGNSVWKEIAQDDKFIHTDNNYTNADKQTVADAKAHISNKNNPHSVTKAQVGLGSVDNTADSAKNVNSAKTLTTPRTIAGTSFDGSKNIDISYTNLTNKPHIAEYTIEEVATTSGYLKTYQLKKDTAYIGAKINIPKDMVVQSGTVKVVEKVNVPYQGAVVGDKYIDLVISNASSSHIYIPVKDLVDVYTAGDHITISDKNVISAIVDTSLSPTSTHPVQNKVVNSALSTKINTSMINNSSTGNVLWTAEKILSQIEQSKSIGYQYTGTVTQNKVVDMVIPAITDFKTPNVEVLVFIDNMWQKAIHGIDYVYAFTTNTNLRVTFFNAGQYKVNYFFMATGVFPNIITSDLEPATQNSGDYWLEVIKG